ncbi:tripartite motif-containing protein 16-like [Carassius gibelio]|uniref:tripartite motif-containing protein 16-like n=1 Tax=Carassius gibelio TaxID=101364 RepID=UPI0022787C9F|nr:tripartite motif-containing protein 16-like [Carassius gibelio]XP_052472465.1 tripartite motif-containing protein 16-like [Carassius gibelio]XP_052472466.1 tripartite motif-containing protein 16-like [Carassius gibelio]
MSESAASQYEDQFICSVCLDRLKEPVMIPCGHSYCMSCITDCWGQKEQEPPYCCPQCKENFSQRPLLKKNTLIAEMMETLQKTSLQMAAVECDVCTTEKSRAVKSCLQCLASFCQTHLQPHYQSPAFMKHKLVPASRNIQENICLSHGKPLEIYCQDDHQCICCLCVTDNHKNHNVVSLNSEWTGKKDKLKEIKVPCQKQIEERERGQQELSEAMKSLKSSAQEAVEDIEKVFTELICSLEKKRSEIKDQIRDQEKTEIDRAEKLHKHLDQDLTELRKTQEEIEKLLITDDQIHCLKSCQSVCVLPSYEDVPSCTQHTHLSFKDISISAFREVLEDVCQQQTAKISREVSNVHVAKLPEPKIQNDFLQYFCQLHLDPNTAHKNIILSEDNRKITCSNVVQQYPDHPERFDEYCNVLCREGLCGRCYWEVECCGNDWAVAVCYKGIGRKGKSDDCKLGFNKTSWRLGYYKQSFGFTHDKAKVSVPAASRIGVYLDQRAGTLCFYSVSDTMTLLHRVKTTFTEPLYLAFGVGDCSIIKIIQHVKVHIDQ